MASISCIEVANFLCDGYEPGADWIPLYRGVTLNLFCNPTALQIDNGGGKSSLTDACLYLLSRDRRLKPKVEDRVAPADCGWTHVRLEFIERDTQEDILQEDFIAQSEDEVPGTHYVVGLCWNRGKEPFFYRYRGTLSDAPCYRVIDDRLELVSNDEFKRSVEGCERVIWNKWGNIQDWQNEIGDYTNMDIIRQNVEFQLEGAGDYSAMVTKVETRNGQPYDVNFFRQFVAPELLRRPLGAESDAEEYKFEDALFRTLKPTALALMEISQREKDLEDARIALEKLAPVERRAQDVIDIEINLNQALERLANSAALIDTLAHRDPLPGVPAWLESRSWGNDKNLACAVSHLLICRKHGVVITDAGLGELIGVSVAEINRRTPSRKILFAELPLGMWLNGGAAQVRDAAQPQNENVTQVYDFKHHLKESGGKSNVRTGTEKMSQVPDFKDHLKESRRGKHRKHPLVGYDLPGAIEAIDAVRTLSRANVDALLQMLPRAFGIGMQADTNAYRREANKHQSETMRLGAKIRDEELVQSGLREEMVNLQRGEHDFHECEIAYETFSARADEFPDEHRMAPLRAEQWASEKLSETNRSLALHDERVGQLKDVLAHYAEMKTELNGTSLDVALSTLKEAYQTASLRQELAQRDLGEMQATLECKRREQVNATQARQNIELIHRDLAALYAYREPFLDFFGDADPETIDPQLALAQAGIKRGQLDALMAEAKGRKALADSTLTQRQLYQLLFDDSTPDLLNPTGDLASIVADMRTHDNVVVVEMPFVQALGAFHMAQPEITPADWLRKVEGIKNQLIEERSALNQELQRIAQELADLDTFRMADERVYSQALKLLAKSDIAFTRLKDIICAHVEGARREQLLILFSAALSAPVVESLEAADAATYTLEQAKLTVPVFLAPGLRGFMEDGQIAVAGNMAYTFLAGRRTRQVDITLNPELMAEERERAAVRTDEITERLSEIHTEIIRYESTSAEITTAVAAGQALERESIEKTRYAMAETERLSELRDVATRRAAPDALATITAQKQYLASGGDQAYQQLVSRILPGLESDVAASEIEIEQLSRQVSPEAGAALMAMRKFKQAGGTKELSVISAKLADASSLIDVIAGEVEGILTRITFELMPNAEQARQAFTTVEQSFESKQARLNAAISFEASDGPAFMTGRVLARQELVSAQSAYQTALQGIDFKRSARYIEQTHAEERSFTERLALAQRQLTQSLDAHAKLGERRVALESRMAEIAPFSDLLHDLVDTLMEQYGRLAILPDDFRTNAARIAPDPAVLEASLALHSACLSEMPGTSDSIRAAIHNIAVAAGGIDLDTTQIENLQRNLSRARREFGNERDHYCELARKGQIKGLQINEIEKIESARTANDLAGLHELKDVITRQVEREGEAVQKIAEAMQSNKVATVDNLVQLARQAEVNLKILQDVMKRHPSACFKIDVQIASEEKISEIIHLLVSDIQDREVSRRARVPGAASNSDIGERDNEYRTLIHDRIYKDIFMSPSVRFVHTAIRPQGETLFTAPGARLSTGQHTALAMMWLVRHAEYAQARAVMTLGTKREQKAALKGSQRIMFFDGLFSNLTNESYIDAAFHGLKDVGRSFQLIGLIHNPHYVNNVEIFPIHLVGKKRRERNIGRERTFMTFKRWQADNGVAYFTSAYKQERPQ